MWLLVQAARGSKYFEPESRVDNQVLISDSSDLVISGRSFGAQGYRFEARKGNETFTVVDFTGTDATASLAGPFRDMAQRLGAIGASPTP
jgi:hypothetical protein